MPQSYPKSFLVILGLVFLSPLFFIPGGALDLSSAKSALFAIGIAAATLLFLWESWREGGLSLPRHHLLTVVALLPVVYLLSALLSTPSSLSLLGYNLEVGTFGYMLIGSAALLLTSTIFAGTSRVLQALVALFASLSLLALFALIKIIFHSTGSGQAGVLVMGNFAGSMGNPLGNWTDLAVALGALSIFTALTIGMIPMRSAMKAFLYGMFFLSTALMAIVGFSTAFALTLGASVLLFLYFNNLEKDFYFHSKGEAGQSAGAEKRDFFSRATFLPLLLGLISFIFLINPNISETRGNLTNVVSNAFNVQNTDVRPTLSATLGVSKAVLAQVALFGSGPNTFGRDWLIFKPVDVNTTPFWGVAFPFGAGFIPTQIATTGILGSAFWLAFFVFLFILAVKVLGNIPESRGLRFSLIGTLIITLFLWVASILYSPSATVLMLAFIFAGLFVAVSLESGAVPARELDLKGSPQARLIGTLLIILLGLGALSLGWVSGKKTIAAYHFNKAAALSKQDGADIQAVEKELTQAVRFSPTDTHFAAISRINFAKAQAAANAATGTPEQNRAVFEEALKMSLSAARAAISANPASYQNWVSLGLIYSALVPDPLKVEGAYENAQFAFSEAAKRNPNNPELPLFLAQLEINKGNVDAARSYIRNSIALKEDYADAYLLLAQLETKEKNIPAAIASAETLAALMPDNAGVHFELGVLKYSNEDYEGAALSLSKALQIVPTYANAKYYLGLSYAKLGRQDEARTQFSELLADNPDSVELQNALKSLNVSTSSSKR